MAVARAQLRFTARPWRSAKPHRRRNRRKSVCKPANCAFPTPSARGPASALCDPAAAACPEVPAALADDFSPLIACKTYANHHMPVAADACAGRLAATVGYSNSFVFTARNMLAGRPGAICIAFLGWKHLAATSAAALLARVRADNATNTQAVAGPPNAELPPPATLCERIRHVRFDLHATIVHEVTPYSEIYGLRPCEFVFDKGMNLIPADLGGFVGLIEAGDSDSSDDDCVFDGDTAGEWQSFQYVSGKADAKVADKEIIDGGWESWLEESWQGEVGEECRVWDDSADHCYNDGPCSSNLAVCALP